MEIAKLWDKLDSDTRQWLVDNPGCTILPRTVAAAIMKSTGVQFEQDRHGETVLSPRRLRLHPRRSAGDRIPPRRGLIPAPLMT